MTESADVFAPELIENGLIQNALNIIEFNSAQLAGAMMPIALSKALGMPVPESELLRFADTAARIMTINKEVVQELKKLIPTDERLNDKNELFQEEMAKRIEESEMGQRLILIQTETAKAKSDRIAKENPRIGQAVDDLGKEFGF